MSARDAADRKMFSPVYRDSGRSPETELCDALVGCGAGATAAGLADQLARRGRVIGTRAAVTRRVAELLEHLETESRVERIADGRYRVVPGGRMRR